MASFLFENDPNLLQNNRIYIDQEGNLAKDTEYPNQSCSSLWRTSRWFRNDGNADTDCLHDVVVKVRWICHNELADRPIEELKAFKKNIKRINEKVESHNQRSCVWLMSTFTNSFDCLTLNGEIRRLRKKIQELRGESTPPSTPPNTPVETHPIQNTQELLDQTKKKLAHPVNPRILKLQQSINFTPETLKPGDSAVRWKKALPRKKTLLRASSSESTSSKPQQSGLTHLTVSRPKGPAKKRPTSRRAKNKS